MKISIIILTILLVSGGIVFSQNNLHIDSLAKNDLIISKLKTNMPKGWVLNMTDSGLVAMCSRKFGLIEGNCNDINLEAIDTVAVNKTAYILYRTEPKWNAKKTFEITEWNDSINLRISTLPQEFGIVQLHNKQKSTRGNIVYTPKNKADEKRIEKFNIRRNELISQKINRPNLNTTTLSLFEERRSCNLRNNLCIVPQEIATEELKVYILFLDYCDNPMRPQN